MDKLSESPSFSTGQPPSSLRNCCLSTGFTCHVGCISIQTLAARAARPGMMVVGQHGHRGRRCFLCRTFRAGCPDADIVLAVIVGDPGCFLSGSVRIARLAAAKAVRIVLTTHSVTMDANPAQRRQWIVVGFQRLRWQIQKRNRLQHPLGMIAIDAAGQCLRKDGLGFVETICRLDSTLFKLIDNFPVHRPSAGHFCP